MKKLFTTLAIVSTAVFFTACEDTKVDFSIPFSSSAERDVQVDSTATFTYSDTTTFNLESNAELKKNISKVKDLSIKKITYAATKLNVGTTADAALVDGTFTIDVLDGTTSVIGGAQTGAFNLADLIANGEQTLAASLTSSSSSIIALLEAGNDLQTVVTLTGVSTATVPVNFTAKATVQFSATAEGL